MKDTKPRSRLLTVQQAAECLGIKPSTIRAWILHREKIEVVIGLLAVRDELPLIWSNSDKRREISISHWIKMA